jgi:uncharacterized protein (TIGR04255 family)
MAKLSTSKALGTLPNAPLAYVVVQIRISNFAEMKDYIPALHAALRPKLRGRRESHVPIFQFSLPEPKVHSVPRWEFYDLTNREGVLIQNESIAFHSTYYDDGASFLQRVRVVLNAVEKVLPDMLVSERIGLRYVDIVVPKDNEFPNEYVAEGLRGIEDHMKPKQSMYLANYELDPGTLVFRYNILPPRTEPLPEELLPLQLDPSPVLQRARGSQQFLGVLDSDRSIHERSEFNPERLMSRLKGMHEDISNLFKAVCSKYAFKVWNEKNSDV